MRTTLNGANQNCGSCIHAVWKEGEPGECHATWWEFTRRGYYRWSTEQVKMRPFLLNKGCGELCRLWEGKPSLIVQA